jgi:1,4-dihydroxy-2-naphthoate octaprenyltransferase
VDLASSDALKNRNRMKLMQDLFIHLRLHYQLLLAPIFLLGYFLTGHPPDGNFWLAFLAFHVFLYGGITAFNSYYDRDEGPVGGLAHPPPVTKALLPFSLVVQGLGIPLAALVNISFLTIYLLIFGLGLAYSYPWIRLKSRPLAGLVTVGLGQGVLASLGGWASALPQLGQVDGLSWMGILAITLITVGFYPLTQIYQIQEDLRRGDLTFAAWVGPKRTFRFALTTQTVGAIMLVGVIGLILGWNSALVVAVVYGALAGATLHWASTFQETHILANYRRITAINAFSSLGFMGFMGLYLFHLF